MKDNYAFDARSRLGSGLRVPAQFLLFALGADGLIGGVAQSRHGYEWVVFEVKTRIAGAFPLDTGELRGVLLFGSVNRDDSGKAYVGGWASTGDGGNRPIVLQIEP